MHRNIPRFGGGELNDLKLVCYSESVGIVVLLSTAGKESVVETHPMAKSISKLIERNGGNEHHIDLANRHGFGVWLGDPVPVLNKGSI